MSSGNSLAEAWNLPLQSQSYSGSGQVSQSDQSDFYRLTIAGRSSLNLVLSGLSGNADLRLLNSAGTEVLLPSSNQGTLAEAINRTLEAGTYFIQVSLGADSPIANYQLGAQLQANPQTDIIWRNYANGSNALWQFTNTTLTSTATMPYLGDVNWQLEATGDFNRDGQQDWVLRNQATGDTTLWYMNGTSVLSFDHYVGRIPTNWQVRATGDFNGDGNPDLVWRDRNTGNVDVWFMNGAAYIGGANLPSVGDLNWSLEGTGDFNADGQSDLVWRNYANGENVVWFLSGTNYIGGAALTTLADTNWQIQGVTDFNHDGSSDLIWRNQVNGENAAWLFQGTTLWYGVSLPGLGDTNWKARVTTRYDNPTPIDVAGNSEGAAFNVGALRGWGQYSDTVGNGDEDYFRFSLAERGRVDLYLWGGGSLSLTGTGIPPVTQGTANGLTLSQRLSPGTYYVRLAGAAGVTGYWLGLYADLTPEAPTGLFLDAASDSGVSQADRVTNDTTPTIRGRAEAGTTVAVFQGGAWLGQATTNAAGDWAVTTGALADGSYSLTARATNGSGDASAMSGEVNLTIDATAPQLSLTAPQLGVMLTTQSRLTGQVNGTNSGAASLTYHFNNSSASSVPLSTTGTFDQALSLTGVSIGAHTLTLTSVDIAGNISTTQLPVTVGEAGMLVEGNSFVVQQFTSLNLSQLKGIVSFDLDAHFDRSDRAAITPDRFLVYLVNDSSQPSQTLLGHNGLPGTAVFALSENQAEFTLGLVSYDGKTVQIDLSSLTTQTQATLIFQLINNDADSGTYVRVQNFAHQVNSAVSLPVDATQLSLAPIGGAIAPNTLNAAANLELQFGDIRVDATTGRYTATLQVRNTGAVATGRQLAVLFANLPSGVQLRSPSGTNATGAPYLNLRGAIPTQGLAPGDRSAPVTVSFDNPNLIKFDLRAQVLTGGANQAPVIQFIPPVTLHPGAYSEVPIAASDADGDSLIYTIATTGTQPPVTIGNNGKLIFRPTPAQVNQTFNFFVVASDGATEFRQAVTLSVTPDPVTSTRISGRVQPSAGQPPTSLAGIAVTWGNLATTTAADGTFTLELPQTLPAGLLKVAGRQATIPGVSYADTTIDVVTRLGHTPDTGTNNQLGQPIYLTTLDPGQTTRITDSTTGITTLKNTMTPGVTVTVPPGALTDANGNLYTGDISITQPDAAKLPVSLPNGVSSNAVFAIDLGTADCNEPLPIQMPNPTPYTGEVDLWGLVNGTWQVVGSGTAAGGSYTSRSFYPPGGSSPTNGIPGSGLFFFAPKALVPKGFSDIDRNPDEICESCKVQKRLHSDASVELHSGAVQESQELVTYQSMGTSRGLRLQYDSLRADPRPIVHFGYSDVQVQSSRDNYRLIAKLEVKLTDGSTYQVPGYQGAAYGLTGGEHLWKLPDSTTVDGSLQVDLHEQQSGIYTYDLTSGIKVLCDCPGNEHFYGSSTTQKDELILVNGIQSPFGSGWGLAGWQELVEGQGKDQKQKVLLIDGDGSQLVFTQEGGAYTAPDGDFSKLENVNGRFRRTTRDGTVYQFNAQKKLETVTDRNGLTTTYQYTGSQLTKIIDPEGLETVLSYGANGRVESITDPVVLSASNPSIKRTTQFVYDANGNLSRITDPDGTVRSFGYDSQHHLTTTIDRIGNQPGQSGRTQQTFYDFAGRATQAIDKDGSLVQVKPSQVQGLRRPNETIEPILSPVAFTTHTAQAEYFDANGNRTRTNLDRAQQEIFSRDAFGTSTQVERSGVGANRYLVTASTDARGNRTTYTYDNRGNVIEMRDSLSSGSPVSDTLFPQPRYQGDSKPVVIDWNYDGNLDLVSSSDGRVAISYGDGHGNFSSPNPTLATSGSFINVNDLNGDGRLDVVSTLSYDSTKIAVQLQQQNGTFQKTELTVPTGKGRIFSVGEVDADGDGDLDLYSGLGYGTDSQHRQHLAVWLNDGQGAFTTPPVITPISYTGFSPSLIALEAGKINQDGLVDFVVSNTSGIFLLQGVASQPSLTYEQTAVYANVGEAKLGDLNGDGKLDLVTIANGSLSSQSGQGNGTFGAATILSTGLSSGANSLTLADANGDGKLDVITTSESSSQVAVRLWQGIDPSGNAVFAAPQAYTHPAQTSLTIGNFNSQVESPSLPGKLDLLFIDSYRTTQLLLNQGDGTYVARGTAASADYSVGSNPATVAVADVNGDGNPDVLTANAGSNLVSVRLGNGTGTFSGGVNAINVDMGTVPVAIAIGDLNGDGKLDFVTANQNGSLSVAIGTGQGGFTTTTTVSALGASPTAIALADVDGNGTLDVVSANRDSHTVSVLKGTGNGTFQAKTDYAVGSQPSAIALGDINGDGKLDIVSANSGSSNVSVLVGNGNGTFGAATNYMVGNQPRAVAIGDINGDGKLDIVAANAGASTISVLLGTGSGSFGKADFAVGAQPRAIALGDVNGDGRLDVLTANYTEATVSVLLGSGGTDLFKPQDRWAFGVGLSPQAIALADLDRDGAIDFVTANANGTISPRLNDRLRVGTPIGTGKHVYEYDTKFNPLTGRFEGQYTTRFNQLTHEVDELGRRTIYELDPTTGNTLRMIRVVGAIDSQAQLDSRAGDDLIMSYTYTSDGRVATMTDALGRMTRYSYDFDALTNPFRNLRQVTVAWGTSEAATQQFEYDAAGNQAAAIDALGRRAEWRYDLKTNRLVQMVAADPDGSGPLLSPITRFEYDANGNQVRTIDPRGFVSESRYDKLNRLVMSIGADPDGTLNAAGRVEVDLNGTNGGLKSSVTTYEYDLNGNLSKTIDPLGRVNTSTYDARNRLVESIRPDKSAQQQGYDLDNHLTRSTDTNGQSSQSSLDARGRRVAETDALGNRSRSVYDSANQLVARVDAKGQVTRFAYDELGRQVRMTDAQGNVTRTEYDKNGNVTATIDPLGNRTEFRFDGRDRRVKVFDPNNFVNGLLIANPKATVTDYDKVGNVLSITDPVGNTTSYLYDGLDRLTTETNQLGLSRTFGYDANGNRVRTVDRNNRERTFEFDGLNRQTYERWIGVNRVIASEYDQASQLTRISDADSTYTYTYETTTGRLKWVDNAGTLNVAAVKLTYGYDRNGNLNSVAETINGQAGATTTYTFDPLDRVSMVTQSGAGIQAKRVDFTYTPLGQIGTVTRFSDLNGTQKVAGTTYQYNALSQLQQLSHKQANQGAISTYTFGYDAAERITRIGSQFANASFNDDTTYTYDPSNQLQGADHSATADESYSYDANGNRTNTGYGTGTDNRLQTDGVYTYAYDHEGNLISRVGNGTTRTFTWDYRNRLTSVMDNGSVTATYTYDAMNRRISKSVGGTTTRFVYDRDNVLLEFTGSAIPSTRYLHGAEVDQVLAQESASGQTTWMLTDHLGTVRDLVNNSGEVVNHFTYDSFGQGVGATGEVETRYKYTGREHDSETGLYYYRARYYDAAVGRFIGQDPIQFEAGDSNLYQYVSNQPIDHKDPTGLYGQVVLNTQHRFIRYLRNSIQVKDTWHIENVPYDGSARILKDTTTALIKHSPTNRPRVNTPIPWGGRRPGPQGDDSGHIVGHALGGSDTDRNNFFAQHWYRNQVDFRNHEARISRKLDPDSFEVCRQNLWPSAAYFIELYYPSVPYPGYPLRPDAISAIASFIRNKPVQDEAIYLDNPTW